MDGLIDDEPLDDVESFLSPNESDERDNVGLFSDSTKGMVNSLRIAGDCNCRSVISMDCNCNLIEEIQFYIFHPYSVLSCN